MRNLHRDSFLQPGSTNMLPRIAVLTVLALAASATAQTKNVQDYLPLAVGNWWTYKHEFIDARSSRAPTIHLTSELTISIVRTEMIDGETYYVFSDISTTMPEGIPNHFLNSKKLRWDGNNLTEHDGTRTFSLYRFNIPPDSDSTTGEYSIQETHGDTLVRTYAGETDRLVHQSFSFQGNPESSPAISFVEHFGVYEVIEGWASGDMLTAQNIITPIRAGFQTTDAKETGARDAGTPSSVTVEWEDFQCYFDEYDVTHGGRCNYPPTSTPASSWGSVKDRSGNR